LDILLLLSTNSIFCFFNATAPTVIYTLSLHDALPISVVTPEVAFLAVVQFLQHGDGLGASVEVHRGGSLVDRFDGVVANIHVMLDRKSTRLNSSHVKISYAVFCLKKKNQNTKNNDCLQ